MEKNCKLHLHIKPVVDGEFLAFKDIKASGDGRDKSIAGMFRVRPLAVCNKAVVQLVRQSRGVVLRSVELVRRKYKSIQKIRPLLHLTEKKPTRCPSNDRKL